MKQYPLHRGFTIVELLVVMGIFTIMTSVVLTNYRSYGVSALFANASEDIILALRQAQVYGVGTKEQAGVFTLPYGVFFDVGSNGIILFGDTDASGTYNTGDQDIETIRWVSTTSLTSLYCDSSAVTNLTVTFRRPSPDAYIISGAACTTGEIRITNAVDQKVASITVSKAGQISLY